LESLGFWLAVTSDAKEMPIRDFFDAAPEEQNVAFIDARTDWPT
jgi:hypothetical protein